MMDTEALVGVDFIPEGGKDPPVRVNENAHSTRFLPCPPTGAPRQGQFRTAE
jgi:hypothetical protein